MKVYDLRKIASACGDYTLYVLAELDKLERGERLKIIVARSARELLEDTITTIERMGVGRVLDKGYENDTYYVVVERA